MPTKKGKTTNLFTPHPPKTEEIKVFLTIFAWWWRDPDPGSITKIKGSGSERHKNLRILNTGWKFSKSQKDKILYVELCLCLLIFFFMDFQILLIKSCSGWWCFGQVESIQTAQTDHIPGGGGGWGTRGICPCFRNYKEEFASLFYFSVVTKKLCSDWVRALRISEVLKSNKDREPQFLKGEAQETDNAKWRSIQFCKYFPVLRIRNRAPGSGMEWKSGSGWTSRIILSSAQKQSFG